MVELFSYNWQLREEWFDWCREIDQYELTKERTGGMGSILKNLFHVVDCEQIWMNQLQGKPVAKKDFHTISTLDEVIEFSETTRQQTESLLSLWTSAYGKKEFNMTSRSGRTYNFTYKKVMQHVVTHEIHHIGQLSVWAREVGKKPVSSDFIFR
ncbi:DinB family protein [Rossellomorea sp. NRS-1567]|uniref:DinB family protein n=1 Tax=Rossellomorea sp. NRS-1567 TaxID=3233901 RepID=UPI003D2DFE52